MFKFEGKSPAEQFANLVKIWLLLLVVTFGSCAAGFKLDAPYTEDVSHNATLEVAYSYQGSCDKYHNCVEKWKGRFKAEDGQRYDREIDGFFYHNFVDKGRQPMPAYITLNKNDQGVETPVWIKFLMSLGILGGFIFIAGGFGLMLGSVDVEYEQRQWEREQESRERNAKWRV
jgi:hypothetical protein